MKIFPAELVETLAAANKVAVLTGSGVSAESGVPTFRDAQTGMWERYRAEDLATPEAFLRNPRLVWEWYEWRRNLVRQAQPNACHYALARLESHLPQFTLITQNVDGLHQRAGSQNVIELHGNITRNKCFFENRVVDQWADSEGISPACPHCGGPLRPDVVWFGEALPIRALELAWQATQDCELFFSIGTSGIVYPAASLPFLALERGIPVIEINPNETPLTERATYVLKGNAGMILPDLIAEFWG